MLFLIGFTVANVPKGLLATATSKMHFLVKSLWRCLLGLTLTTCSNQTGTLTRQKRIAITLLCYNSISLKTDITIHTEKAKQENCVKELVWWLRFAVTSNSNPIRLLAWCTRERSICSSSPEVCRSCHRQCYSFYQEGMWDSLQFHKLISDLRPWTGWVYGRKAFVCHEEGSGDLCVL